MIGWRSGVALIAVAAIGLPAIAAAPPFETAAPIAFMQDLSSGAVLYAKNADQVIPPASMAKMMTAKRSRRAMLTSGPMALPMELITT